MTKKPIKVIVEPIGKATFTEVDENTATATFSGAGQVKLRWLQLEAIAVVCRRLTCIDRHSF